MEQKREWTPASERQFNPFASIGSEDWERCAGQFVAVHRLRGGIVTFAASLEQLVETMAREFPSIDYLTMPVPDLSPLAREIYKDLCRTCTDIQG